MSALTSLLVRDRVVPVKKIEEAIQRQVISGGALDTVLLEVGAAPENVLASYCAAVFRLAPVAAASLMTVPRDVIRLVPREVAEQHRIVPLAAQPGRVTLAVHEPLTGDVEHQLAFLLGATLEQRVSTQARLEAALGAHYGVELSPRLKRLVRKLADTDEGTVVEVAVIDENRRTFSDELAPTQDATEAVTVGPSGPPASLSLRAGRASEYGQGSGQRRNSGGVAVNVARIVGAESTDRSAQGSGSTGVAAVRPSQHASPNLAARPMHEAASASADTRTASMERPPRSELLQRIRGPFTARVAVELLDQVSHREEVLQVSLAFVQQFFNCAVLFAVHDDVAEGLDVQGSGPDYATVRRTFASVNEAGILSDAFRSAQPRLGDLESGTRADQQLSGALGRANAQPCVVAPVVIRQRVVLLFYGDRGGEDFGISDVPEFVAFMPRISEAFQRLILRRKLGKAAPEAAPVDPRGTIAKRWQVGRRNWVAEVSHTPRPRAKKRRTQAMDLLGVPRTAPPPPFPVAHTAAPHGVAAKANRVGDTTVRDDPESAYTGFSETAEDRGPLSRGSLAPGAPERVSEGTMLAGAEGRIETTHNDEPIEREPSRSPTSRSHHDTLVDLRPVTELSGGTPEPVTVAPAITAVDADVAHTTARALADATEASSEVADLEGAPRSFNSVRPAGGVYSMKGTTDVLAPSRHSRTPSPREPTPQRFPKPRTENVEGRRDPGPAHGPMTQAPDMPGQPIDVVESTRTIPDAAPVAVAASFGAASARAVVDPGMPSVILDLGDGVETAVRQLLTAGPEDVFAVKAALRAGEAVLPALVREFPGQLWFDRNSLHQRLPRGRDVSAVSRAMVAFGDVAVPYVVALLDREDHDVRFYATLLSAELSHRDLIDPLGRRVFDVDAGTRALALDVLRPLRRYPREFGAVIDRVRASARIPARPLPIRLVAVKALGHLRDEGALELLVRTLESDDERLRDAAQHSLVLLTRQDFGRSREAWAEWVTAHRSAHRIEWLIDALTHEDANLRRQAGEELKHLTQAYYGYQPSLPKRDREVAQRKYRQWWESEGRTLFR